ncbi:MAG: hypothetical protein ABIO46_07610, partial [Chitinophagales bacterium]
MCTKTITTIFFQLFFFACVYAQTPQAPVNPVQPGSDEVKFPDAKEYANTNLTYNIIDAPNNTFCYDIYSGGRLT